MHFFLSTKVKRTFAWLLFLTTVFIGESLYAQLNDGPIELQVRLKRVAVTNQTPSDFTLDIGPFTPPQVELDEYTFKVWAMANPDVTGIGWQGGNCNLDEFIPPAFSRDFQDLLFNVTYPGLSVPASFDLKHDCWEDEAPGDFDAFPGGIPFVAENDCQSSDGYSRCNFDQNVCCVSLFGACVVTEGDDRRCDAEPYQTGVNYRNGPPCQWFNHGFITGGGCSDNDYEPEIESYWRYTKGTACSNTDAIDIGTLVQGGSIEHFNSNECYSNNFSNSPGNDVTYRFEITTPLGISMSLCGVDGAQFDSWLYLLDRNCNILADNDDGCGTQSIIQRSFCETGVYYLVVDGKTAADMGTFTLRIEEDPNFTFSAVATATDASCNGFPDGSMNVQVSGGVPPYNYTWNPAAANNDTITGLGPNIYSVTVTDDDGCTIAVADTVNEPDAMVVTITPQNVTCGGVADGNATASPSGGTSPYFYLWNTTPIQQTSQTAVALSPGNYEVTVTDFNGCSVSESTSIAQATNINLSLASQSNVSCFGANDGSIDIDVSGGNTPYTYEWSNAATSQDLSGLGQGVYSVTVTDLDNCTIAMTFNPITEPAELIASLNTTIDASCAGEDDGIADVSVTGGTQPYSYAWNSSQISEDLFNVQAGNYTFTVTDNQGCVDSLTATISEPSAISVVKVVSNTDCFGGTDGAVTLAVSGGSTPYDFLWSDFSSSQDLSNAEAGNYTVVITDDNGCMHLDSAVISEPAEIITSFTTTDPGCSGTDGAIDLTVSGGTGALSFEWSDASTDEDLSGVGDGTYSVTVTDANGCTAEEMASLNVPAPLTATVTGIDVVCIDQANGSAATSVNGGNGPYTYTWDTDPVQNAAVAINLASGVYTVTITDADNCEVIETVTVNEPLENPESCQAEVFVTVVPTAFSPNGDGINDRLVVLSKGAFKIEIVVFNRWGEKVYANSNLIDGNGWDGNYKGEKQPMGVYSYLIKIEYENGVRASETGVATLLR